ncbi:MAG: hypothetical protein IJS90_02365 [Clostridia bacterium]|nr:hypothetical protein [Clostridia bacterium]
MKNDKMNVSESVEAVFIPKESKHDDSLYVAVNGRRMLVKKGESVLLPKSFAEVVKASFAAKKNAESYIDSVCSGG